MNVILASESARRKYLLRKICRRFRVIPAKTKETVGKNENPAEAAERLARLKAFKVASKHKDSLVVAADTIAYFGKKIFGKTQTIKKAKTTLSFLSGKVHRVSTGVAIVFPSGKAISYTVTAKVKMKKLGEELIKRYIQSGEWKDRAGCYDISGLGKCLIEKVWGEREAVVGLPLKRLKIILSEAIPRKKE